MCQFVSKLFSGQEEMWVCYQLPCKYWEKVLVFCLVFQYTVKKCCLKLSTINNLSAVKLYK